ncbi:MAG: substrate-binding domain-containing protein, partial [Deltaproteobacteria bacterium]|nr:substrate-binding domain-containing protein [Deltaproteobacteria bacterium]
SIVGIDDSRLATICAVPLTSVRHPHQRLGERAAETLLSMLGATSAGKQGHLFEPILVKRASTARAISGGFGERARKLSA